MRMITRYVNVFPNGRALSFSLDLICEVVYAPRYPSDRAGTLFVPSGHDGCPLALSLIWVGSPTGSFWP